MQQQNNQSKRGAEKDPPRRDETTGKTWDDLPLDSPRPPEATKEEREPVETPLRKQKQK
jgi:hypothetical protein